MIDDDRVGLSSFIKFIITLLQGILEKTFLQCAPLYMACVIHIFIAMFFCNSSRHQNSFFPNTIKLWNNLGKEFQVCKSIETFKKYITSMIKPPLKSLFHIHIPRGTSCIFQLLVGLSPLNSHKKYIISSEVCNCETGIENTEHFLLKCPLYFVQRTKMAASIMPILAAK